MEIKLGGLKKYYSSFCAVNGVSFCFSSGKLMALVGRNGSGKTTTIRTLLRLLKKDGGKILVNGKEAKLDLKNVGYLAEERGMFLKETVLDQLVFFAALKGVEKKQALKGIDYWLEKLEISQYKKSYLESLSKGNQQKVQMVACLVHNPDVIIFDEPFSGLDPVNMKLVMSLLRQFKEDGKCVLVSSHQLALIEEVCDEVTIINKSNIMYTGTIDELKAKHAKKYVTLTLNKEISMPKELNAIKKRELSYIVNLDSREAEDLNLFLRKVINYNLPISSIERGQETLQDIFLGIVGEEDTESQSQEES